jgi:hypothetical protein
VSCMVFLSEAQRQWLLAYSREFGPDWLVKALELEDPKRRFG